MVARGAILYVVMSVANCPSNCGCGGRSMLRSEGVTEGLRRFKVALKSQFLAPPVPSRPQLAHVISSARATEI
jgi:hypothetical protein